MVAPSQDGAYAKEVMNSALANLAQLGYTGVTEEQLGRLQVSQDSHGQDRAALELVAGTMAYFKV